MTGEMWLRQFSCYSMGAGATLHDPIVITPPGRGGYDKLRIAPTARVDSFVKLHIGEGIDIGDHVHIASFCDVNVGGGGLSIGEGATLSSGVLVCTGQSRILPGRSGSAASPEFEPEVGMLFIQKNVTVFAGAIIIVKPNTVMTIGEGAVVAAGSIVTKNVKPYTLVMGQPAQWRKDLDRASQ